jgi:hypothetical protein
VSTESVTVTIRNADLADEMGAAEWDDQPVLICASKAALASMLDDAGVDVTAPVKADVETAVATFRQFAALSVEDAAPHDEDGDGILAQFGTYDLGGQREFSVDFTRQFITAGSEDLPVWQLNCTFFWASSEATDALASGHLWSFGRTLSEFFDEAVELPGWAWALRASLVPERLSVTLSQV